MIRESAVFALKETLPEELRPEYRHSGLQNPIYLSLFHPAAGS